MSGFYRLMVKLSDQLITQKRALAAEAAAKAGGDGRGSAGSRRVQMAAKGGSVSAGAGLEAVREEVEGEDEAAGAGATGDAAGVDAAMSTPSPPSNQPKEEEEEQEEPGPFTQFQRLFMTPPRDAERVEKARRVDLPTIIRV